MTWVSKNFGRFVFWVLSFVTLGVLLSQGQSGHYDFFSFAARELWKGRNPYLVEFPSGFFNYSPLAGLLYYGPFAFLPYFWGLLLLSLLALLTFWWGAQRLFRSFEIPDSLAQIFWILSVNEVIGALLNVRIELFFAGLLMWGLELIFRGKNLRGLICFALAANFKLQALAPLGLLFCIWIFFSPKRILVSLGLIALSFLLPLFVIPRSLWKRVHLDWLSSVGGLVGEGFYTFQHFWAFLKQTFHFQVPQSLAQILTMAVALSLACFFAWKAFRVRNFFYEDPLVLKRLQLQALAFGVIFVSSFSPASQSAAYVLMTPAFLFLLVGFQSFGQIPFLTKLFIFVGWFFTSGLSSDLVGQNVRKLAYEKALKPLGPLFLLFGSMLLKSSDKKRSRSAGREG